MTDTTTTAPAEALPAPGAAHARAAVAGLRMALAQLNREGPTLIEQWAPADLALFLGLLQSQLAELRAIEAYASLVLGDQLTKGDTRWPDGMRAERKPAYSESWDREATTRAVTADLFDNPDPAYAAAARETVRRLQECARFEFRMTDTKGYLGDALDEYHHRKRTHWTVKVSLPAGAASGGAE